MDTEQQMSLTVYFGHNNKGFSQVNFRLYQIAIVSEDKNLILTDSFSGYPIKIDELDSSGWKSLAQTLDGFVLRDHLEIFHEGKTSDDGKITFYNLEEGLYLITGEQYKKGEYIYTPDSFLVRLPAVDGKTNRPIYDVESSCKYESKKNPSDNEEENTVDREVIKIWKDNKNKKNRPNSIVVQLLRDSAVYDTVVLNDQNNWKYIWRKLDSNFQWRVVEYSKIDGYTTTVELCGNTFVVTNSIPEQPTPASPNIPNESPPSENSNSYSRPKLPQTGLLWWPVPLLACEGLFLFIIGWRKNYHGK